MTTDTTQKGASTEETQELDIEGKKQDDTAQGSHPVVERSHPAAQREALLERAEAYRKQNRPDTLTAGNLGAEEPAEELGELLSEEEKAAIAGIQPQTTAKDPVEEFIVKDNAGKAFFKTTVDGKEQLVPLDRARAQLQKHEAAEFRLQTASERLRALEAREAEIAKREREAQASQTRSPSAPDASADDAAIDKEAAELVTSLIEDDATEAAKKLASALKKARSTSSPVDTKALVTEVAQAVVVKQTADAQNVALAEGYNAYLKEYGETVNQDPALRAWHAAKVDALVEANPSWTPKQAMLEAGKLAEEFAGIKRGSQASTTATTTPAPQDTRQQRKQALQPVPQSRSAVRGVDKPAQVDNSPQKVLDEMRKSRGQPVLPSRRTA